MTDRVTSFSHDPPSPPRHTKLSPSLSTTTSLSLIRTHTQPAIDELKLSHVLNGETCPPISFQDFASFIANKEFSTENLLFVIWFRSYRARYNELPNDTKLRIPVPSTRLGDRHQPFEYLKHLDSQPSPSHAEIKSKPRSQGAKSSTGLSADAKLRADFKVCDWSKDGRKPCRCGDPAHSHSKAGPSRFPFGKGRPTSSSSPSPPPILQHSSLNPPVPPPGTVFLDPGEQPLREEAARAFATFLKKEGSRELGISDDLREFARTCLQRSTAPEVFLPIYEEVYQVIETQSLPHFLTYAKANINRPKQLFWYAVGTFDILIGVIIFLILTLLLPQRKYTYRLIRLPSLIFVWFGCAQFYSAYRGFCNQVWGRESMQMKPWELDDADEESLLGNGNLARVAKASVICGPEVGESKEEGTSTGTNSTPEVLSTPLPRSVEPHAEIWEKDPWGKVVEDVGKPVGSPDGEISDIAQKQLALRRATIKIPDASLAFPIGVDDRQNHAISPFDSAPAPAPGPPTRDVRADAGTVPGGTSDLSDILAQYDFGAPKARPSAPAAAGGKSKVPVFGPERVVQDQRIISLYKSIVRDIIIVASIFGVLWLVLILAVPNRGLLS